MALVRTKDGKEKTIPMIDGTEATLSGTAIEVPDAHALDLVREDPNLEIVEKKEAPEKKAPQKGA